MFFILIYLTVNVEKGLEYGDYSDHKNDSMGT